MLFNTERSIQCITHNGINFVHHRTNSLPSGFSVQLENQFVHLMAVYGGILWLFEEHLKYFHHTGLEELVTRQEDGSLILLFLENK